MSEAGSFVRRAYSGTPWEQSVGYCRAIAVGATLEVSGTTAVVEGRIVHRGDAFGQTTTVLSIIEQTVAEIGGPSAIVTRLRVFVVNATDIEAVTAAYAASSLAKQRPAMTLVVVSGLIDQELLVEIEASAVIVPE